MKTPQAIIVYCIAGWILTGCGDTATATAQSEKISHGPLNPLTGQFRCKFEDATLIKPGGIVTPLREKTQIRVWHMQNSDEYVCLLRGDAAVHYDAS